MNTKRIVKLWAPPILTDAVRSAKKAMRRNRDETPDFSDLIEPFRTIKKKVPEQNLRVIFDVGANKGQSCIAYQEALPDAIIHAFEPFPETFSILEEAVSEKDNIMTHNIALSDQSKKISMSAEGDSRMYRVTGSDSDEVSMINAMTIADFCDTHHIDHIDFMKIDTEGHDLAVLKGCGIFIGNMDFVQCEASANRYNRFHNSFEEIFDFMTKAGFYLFDIQGLAYEWTGDKYPVLRRFDPVFINGRVVGEMKGVVRC